MSGATLFEPFECRFGQIALGRLTAIALKDAAADEPIGINAASALNTIGTDALGHRLQRPSSVMGKIQQLRRCQVKAMPKCVKIAAPTARTARMPLRDLPIQLTVQLCDFC